MSSSALKNKFSDGTKVEGMQRYFQATWPCDSIQCGKIPIPVLAIPPSWNLVSAVLIHGTWYSPAVERRTGVKLQTAPCNETWL